MVCTFVMNFGFLSGQISIKDFETLHSKYFNSKLGPLRQELEHMVDRRVLEERQRQVQLCAEVDHCHNGAQTMLDMRDKFGLTGDFSDMDHILESVSLPLQPFVKFKTHCSPLNYENDDIILVSADVIYFTANSF